MQHRSHQHCPLWRIIPRCREELSRRNDFMKSSLMKIGVNWPVELNRFCVLQFLIRRRIEFQPSFEIFQASLDPAGFGQGELRLAYRERQLADVRRKSEASI